MPIAGGSFRSPDATQAVITVHPSYLLRLQEVRRQAARVSISGQGFALASDAAKHARR
jgi:hypothetical protein